jgi:hypothetical protein
MTRDPNELTEAELAEWQYAHREELDSEEGEEVEVEISPQLSVTISFRLPGAEADAIREAAGVSGLSLSEWIRQACADALDPAESASSGRKAQAELREAGRELEKLARRLSSAASAAPTRRSGKQKVATKRTMPAKSTRGT